MILLQSSLQVIKKMKILLCTLLDQKVIDLVAGTEMLVTPKCRGYATTDPNYCGGSPGDGTYRADIPLAYKSDEVLNTEIGIKTLLMDGAMRLNATYYNIEWTGIQVSQFDPVHVNFITFVENAANADISGVEADMLWYPSDTLTVAAAISLNDTEIVEDVAKTIPIVDIGNALPLAPKDSGMSDLEKIWEQMMVTYK